MKKHILLLAAIAICTAAFSQEKLSFGIKAGVSHSGLKGEAVNNLQDMMDFSDGMITTQNKTGFFAGGNAIIPVSKSFSVEPGLYYSQKGYALKGELDIKGISFLGANAKAQLNTHYIDLPVVAKVNVGGLQLFAGPQLSYLAKADLRMTAGALGFNLYDEKMDATDELNRWDAAITGGIGYQFTNGMNIAASYDHGLSKTDANKRFDSYNRSFKVGVGFTF
jgi:hypothetical protein